MEEQGSQARKLCPLCQREFPKGGAWCCPSCLREYKRMWWKNNPSARLNNNLKTLYGITREQYTAMLEMQGGVCAICKQAETRIEPRTKTVARLIVDHDHTTGAIRSLLCQRCNVIVGILEANLDQLDRYLRYVQQYQEG